MLPAVYTRMSVSCHPIEEMNRLASSVPSSTRTERCTSVASLSMTRISPEVGEGRTNAGEVDRTVAQVTTGVRAVGVARVPAVLACIEVVQHRERVHAAVAKRETNGD